MIDGLDEVLDTIKKSKPRAITPFGQRAPLSAPQVVLDTNPTEADNKRYSRIVRLQCSVCGAQWSACYEGPNIRHREDLICFRCTKH